MKTSISKIFKYGVPTIKNKSEALNKIIRRFLLSFLAVLVFTSASLSQDNSINYSLFIGIISPKQPQGFDNYYLDGISGGGILERRISSAWSSGVKVEYARFYPDITAVTDWRNEVSVDFKPNNSKYGVNLYAITGVLRRQFGNSKEDMRYFSEFEIGPHLFKGRGLDSVPTGLRKDIKVSGNKVQFGAGIEAGIKWDWDEKYATFVQVGWHKILMNHQSKSYIPLMAGIRF